MNTESTQIQCGEEAQKETIRLNRYWDPSEL